MERSDSEGEYEVEEILKQRKSRKRGVGIEYLVRWRGFGEENDSWEPAKNLTGAKDAIEAFNNKGKTEVASGPSLRSRGGASTTTERTVTQSKVTTVVTQQVEGKSGTTTRSSYIETSKAASSSAESSPVLQRKAKQILGTPWKGQPQKEGGLLKLTRHDIPIVILLTCILFIVLTFIIQK